MKLLVLSCDTGEGHNSAARAITEELERRGLDYTQADPLSFGRKKTAGIVAASYNGIIKKAPAAFGMIYRVGDLYSSAGLTSPIYFANSLYAGHLEHYITENGFDAVITTHLFAMEAMTAVHRKTDCRVPCYGILTDYTCIPFFAETKLEAYFIPHEDLRQEMVDKGMERARLVPTGIPVGARFAGRLDKAAARERLGIPQDGPLILIMTGGVGCGNITDLCDEVLRQSRSACRVCVLTGHNDEMKQQLDERYAGLDWLQTVPFTTDVSTYMNAADVLISKPGGLSTTEAAVANVPLVHILAFSGCETKNAEFFSQRGMSIRADNAQAAVEAAWSLIRSPERAEQMRQAQRRHINPYAARDIVARVTGDLGAAGQE